jgi:N-methylhydantoinase B
VNKYGRDTYLLAIRRHMDYGEQVTLQALRRLPHGRFELAEEQDDGRIFNVAVEITEDSFTVDLRDNPDQENGPSNICLDGTTVVAQMILKGLTETGMVCNGGTFRPLRLLTRAGSLFDAKPPAALGFYFETEIRLYDLIWRCLAPHMPDRLPAGHFASICGTVIGGIHPDTGRHFTIVEPELGGWGAFDGQDGATATFSAFHGETFNCPAEISEARNGLFVESVRLNDAAGGAGRFRGGKGVRIDYRIRSDGCFLTCGYTRSRIPPWGLSGGEPGTLNYIEVRRTSGVVERQAFATGVPLNEGDVVGVVTGNGGGFGAPGERDRLAVRADLQDGYVTSDEVRDSYGAL